jgi:hypothetical protein
MARKQKKRRVTQRTQASNEFRKRDEWSGRRCAEHVSVKLAGKHKWQRQLCGRLLPCPLHGGKRR